MTDFLAANWLWIVVVVAMLAMHRGGGCGSHGHSSHGSTRSDRTADAGRDDHVEHR